MRAAARPRPRAMNVVRPPQGVFADCEGPPSAAGGAVELACPRTGFPICWDSIALRPGELTAAKDARTDTRWGRRPAGSCPNLLTQGDGQVSERSATPGIRRPAPAVASGAGPHPRHARGCAAPGAG
jgi:hypothetical protein